MIDYVMVDNSEILKNMDNPSSGESTMNLVKLPVLDPNIIRDLSRNFRTVKVKL